MPSTFSSERKMGRPTKDGKMDLGKLDPAKPHLTNCSHKRICQYSARCLWEAIRAERELAPSNSSRFWAWRSSLALTYTSTVIANYDFRSIHDVKCLREEWKLESSERKASFLIWVGLPKSGCFREIRRESLRRRGSKASAVVGCQSVPVPWD